MKSKFKFFLGLFLMCCMLSHPLSIFTENTASAALTSNLIGNPSFESTIDGIPSEWQAMGDTWNSNIQATADAAKTGNYGISIRTDIANNPWVAIPVPVEAGVTYDISSWYKSIGVSGSIGYKLEYFKGIEKTADNWVTGFSPTTSAGLNDGQWHELKYETVAPPESKYLYLYLRLYGKGTVYFDDTAMVKKIDRPQLDVQTDHVYYYPDIKTGTVSLEITPYDGVLTDKTVDIQIVKESDGTQLFAQTGITAAGIVSASFDPNIMALEQTNQLIVELKDSSQQVLEKVEKKIYRWERPGNIPVNGPIMVDDKPFFPVIAYHASVQDYAALKEIGVNTVQGGNTNNTDVTQSLLDSAHASGLKMLMPLYNNMKVQENYELTRQMVTKFKNHPALLGYMIMDEPTTNGIPQSELLDAYQLIRSIDSVHPTYIVEADPIAYQSTGQATDILVTDVYPFYKNSTLPITEVGHAVRKAVADVNDMKPVWTILQTFQIPNTNWNVLPTIDQLRNMAYQSFLAGSKGLGFYSINDPGWKLQQSELWPGMVKFKDEINLMGDLLVNGHKIAQNIDDPVQWGIWQKGVEKYAVAINVTKDSQTVTLPLGQVGNQVELQYGSNPSQWGSWDDELTINLGPEQTFVYKITSFADSVNAANSELQGVREAISNGHWSAQSKHLMQELQKMSQQLATDLIDIKQTIDRATNFLRELSHLQLWVNMQSDDGLDGTKQDLIASLDSVKTHVLPITQSIIRIDLLSSIDAVTPGDAKSVTVNLQNVSKMSISNAQLRIDWPESFGLPPFIKNIRDLIDGESDTSEASIIIPEVVNPGDYSIRAAVSYTFKGFDLSVATSENLVVTPLLSAKLTPGEMTMNQAGTYPFSVELVNHSGRTVTVELARSVPNGITGELAPSVTLSANETKTILGHITVPAPLNDNEYSVSIEAKVSGAIVATLPLIVHVETNLVYNGGFEEKAVISNQPNGWQMRASVWDKSVAHSGQASVRLNPDHANLFNVVNTDVPKAIPVIPGKKYVVKGWVKNSATAGLVSLGVRQANASSVTLTYAWKDTQLNSDWTLYEISFTALPQAKTAWIYFKLDPAANGPAWIDDVELSEAQS
jgi:hypothetical protein